MVGVDPDGEAKISSIAAIDPRRPLSLALPTSDAAILGDFLARNLGLSVGGKVTLLGAARDGSVAADVLRVVGIYHSGIPELDRSILEMPLRPRTGRFRDGRPRQHDRARRAFARRGR